MSVGVAVDNRHGRILCRVAGLLLGATALVVGGQPAGAAPIEDPFTPVLHGVVAGDLVMAGNSNLVSAGGWRSEADAAADVDGDATELCLGRRTARAACAENSSSATLDVPVGARVLAARLYVNTTLAASVNSIRVRLDGPDDGFGYTELSDISPGTGVGITKVRESAGTSSPSAQTMRQAVWDVTGYVQAAGGGTYTVADIVFERTRAYLPYASWTIVAAYELDPAADTGAMDAPQQARFDPRAISWDDGFAVLTGGAVDVQVDGFQVAGSGAAPFAKTFHLAAHSQHRGPDSILFGGQPLGNNATPGDTPAPIGTVVGTDPACNSTTDIFNDTICQLGSPVTTKDPADTVASLDGRTPSSGSGVDFDVTRVPSRYLVADVTSATLSVQSGSRGSLAVGMLAASVDLTPADGTGS